ncbi:MAG: SH3 domain-containing protein, partial [Bacteroidota bacterium]
IGKSLMDGNKNPNYFVIGIEMCVNADGDWDKTYQNSVELTQYLLNLHNFTIHQLWRHYDITGKDCPKMMIDEAPWQAFRKDVNEGLKLSLRDPVKKGTIRVDDFLNVREGNGTSYGVVDRLHDGDSVEIYDEFDNWVRVGDNKWIHGDYVDINESRRTGRVKVEGDNLNVRQGPGTRFSIVGKLQNGDTVEIIDSQGVWFKLNASGNEEQWVHSHYITFEEYPKGIVTSEKLVVRDGPGTNFSKILRLTEGDIVEIQETEGHWYRIGENQWVIRNYIKTVSLS